MVMENENENMDMTYTKKRRNMPELVVMAQSDEREQKLEHHRVRVPSQEKRPTALSLPTHNQAP
jgi:hypothetical protein